MHIGNGDIMLDYDYDLKLCLCTRLLGRAHFKPWGVKKNSVPYMAEIVLTNVLVECWIVYPYEDRFLDDPGLPLVLPVYDVETCFCDVVPCLLYVCIDGGGLFEVFLASFSKGPGCLPYVFFITVYVIAWETVDYPTLLFFRVLVLRFHEDLFDCCVALELSLYPILTTGVFEAFH